MQTVAKAPPEEINRSKRCHFGALEYVLAEESPSNLLETARFPFLPPLSMFKPCDTAADAQSQFWVEAKHLP